MILPIVIALVSGVSAFYLGAYRQKCIMMEENFRFNVPQIWYSLIFRLVSWLLVTALSITSAVVLALIVGTLTDSVLICNFSFGVVLFIRWAASGLSAANYEAEVEEDFLSATGTSREQWEKEKAAMKALRRFA